MKLWKLVLPFALLFASAAKADQYFDFNCQVNGNGTVGTGGTASGTTSTSVCAEVTGDGTGPYNTPANIVWSANGKYYFKGTWTGDCTAKNLITASGSAGNPLTITSYGGSKAAFVCTNGYVFGAAAVPRTYISITNLDLTSTTNQCLLLQASDHDIIQNNIFRRCSSNVIGLDGSGAAHTHTNLLIDSNSFGEYGNVGTLISGILTTNNSTTWSNISFTNNTIGPNFNISSNYGINVTQTSYTLATGAATVVAGQNTLSCATTCAMGTDFAVGDTVIIDPAGSAAYSGQKRIITAIDTVSSPNKLTITGSSTTWAISATSVPYAKWVKPTSSIKGFYVSNNIFYNFHWADTTNIGQMIQVSWGTTPAFPDDSDVRCGSGSASPSTVTPTIYGVRVTNNVFVNSHGEVVLTGNGVDATYGKSIVSGNTFVHMNVASAVITFFSQEVQTTNNNFYDVNTSSTYSYFDGSPVDYDMCNQGGEISSNTIDTSPGSVNNPELSGTAIEWFGSQNLRIFGNSIRNPRFCFFENSVSSSGINPNYIYNNTCVNPYYDGVSVYKGVPSRKNSVYKNNIFVGAGQAGSAICGARATATGHLTNSTNGCYGFNGNTAANNVLDYNLYYNNLDGNVTGSAQSADSHPILANPKFEDIQNGLFRLQPGSPADNAGTCYLAVGCTYPDVNGQYMRVPPNVGAYGYTNPDNRQSAIREAATGRLNASGRTSAGKR